MREIEVKFLEINAPKLQKRLRQLGAKKVFNGKMQALYFDDAKANLRKRNAVLRLRQKGNHVELAFKKDLKGSRAKVMRELETLTRDFGETKSILIALGYRVIQEIQKRRISYRYAGNQFEFDTFKGCPTLLEIESVSIHKLKQASRHLGLSLDDSKAWDSFQVLDHYRKFRKKK